MPGDHRAEEIDLKLHDRDFMVGQLRTLLKAQNESFAASYGKPIWDPKLLDSNKMFSGSSLTFFDVKGVSTQDFMNKLQKTKVGDIDTQIDQSIGEEVTAWLKSVIGKQIGNGTFVGFNSSLSALWQLQDPPVKVQIDYELGPYQPAKGKEPAQPTEWFAYSHSSDLADMEAGIKGVFHKWINRALTHAQASTKYVARVLKKGVKISPEPVTDADYSFAVTSSQGGGLAGKYKPYIDPETGQPMEIDGIPVMQLLDTSQRDYVQNLDLQFQTMYGAKRTAADKKLQNSFVGTIDLMNNHFNVAQNDAVAQSFIDICFGQGAQMITSGDPTRDRDTKLAAIDYMVEHLALTDAAAMRQQAIDLAMEYEAKFNARQKPVAESLNEAEVQAQLRKNMPHLRALKPLDLLDLLDEIHDGNGNFKLQNMPLNVKIDGFGGRFGKNAEGKPFMGTSNTPPRYEANFLAYHQNKGTTDPDILNRSALFDNLFNEMMNAIATADESLGEDFLVDKQVTCEVLYLPFATETPEGKLKFVGIHYDKLPEGVQLALVPYRVVSASTGEDLPDTDRICKALTNLGQQGSVMFISNKLTQNDALDVTGIVPPMENLETFKQILSSSGKGTLELKRQVKAALEPVALALEKAIIEDPNIVGKDILGQNYEGIVLNTRLGPVKVTSAEQRKVIADKQAAAKAARVEQPTTGNKTAVVAIGSFVGHIGHQQLWDYTVDKAKEVGGDPYLFMGNAVGKDDPIPVETKLATWHKLYPDYANNISATMAGGSLMQKIKHELINPLPGKPPRYDNIIIMVGEDQSNMPIANALMKAVNKFPGYEHVKVSLEATPRGTGMSFSKLRNILKDPNATPQQQLDLWSQAFDVNTLGVDWIKSLMDITRKGMGIQMPQQQQQQPPVQQPVPERLFNALVMPQLNEGDWGKAIGGTLGGIAGGAAGTVVAPVAGTIAGEIGGAYAGGKIGDKIGDMISPDKKQTDEDEGDPEGVPHLTKELLTHIIQQVGPEGAHAIVKSLQWGDGAAKELLQLIVKDLKQDISMAESVKQRLDPSCWKGYHKAGTKVKGGTRVNNCVPNEAANPAQQAAIAIAKKKKAGVSEDISRRGFLKGAGAAAAAGAAGKASAIAGAFPSPSTREKWAKDAAASNAAEAKRQAAIQAKKDAERLQHGTDDIERLNKINYHGGKITPTNAEWDGDGDFMYLDGTQYSMASRMPIKGDEPRDMKLISTREGRQVYIWTRYRMKGDGGHYFYPAPAKNSMSEARQSNAVKLQKAWEREQEKSAAASKRGMEYMNKLKEPAPKKEEPAKEAMLPASAFAGSKKNKLGTAGQWNQSKKRPAKAGDLVGGAAESIEQEHIVKVKGGYELKSKHGNKNLGKYPTKAGAEKRERQVQYFKHAGESVIPVREDVENIIGSLVEQLSRK